MVLFAIAFWLISNRIRKSKKMCIISYIPYRMTFTNNYNQNRIISGNIHSSTDTKEISVNNVKKIKIKLQINWESTDPHAWVLDTNAEHVKLNYRNSCIFGVWFYKGWKGLVKDQLITAKMTNNGITIYVPIGK